jgi:hypothetical protein
MEHYETLALVRSPYEHFLSALAQHLTAFHPNLDYYAADKEALRRYAERFIDQELRMERMLGNARFIHFRSRATIKAGRRHSASSVYRPSRLAARTRAALL